MNGDSTKRSIAAPECQAEAGSLRITARLSPALCEKPKFGELT